VLLLTLILVEWQELGATTLFFALQVSQLEIWSEADLLTHWSAPLPMVIGQEMN